MNNFTSEALESYIKAGKIAKSAIEYGKNIIKEAASVFESVTKIENFILDSGGNLAFPVNVSANDEAAHYTPSYNDSRLFNKGDLIKLDLGVHINGYIADTAITVEVGSNTHDFLITSSKKALENVIKEIHVGMELSEIGTVIEDSIKFYEYNPIYNLTGHELSKFKLHSGKTVPNYNNKDHTRLEVGTAIAIEPFATTGVGLIKEHNYGGIAILTDPPKKDSLGYYDLLFQRFNRLPFAERWLYNRIEDHNKVMEWLLKNGNLYMFPILKEKKRGLVTQAEHTFLVTVNGIIVTTI